MLERSEFAERAVNHESFEDLFRFFLNDETAFPGSRFSWTLTTGQHPIAKAASGNSSNPGNGLKKTFYLVSRVFPHVLTCGFRNVKKPARQMRAGFLFLCAARSRANT